MLDVVTYERYFGDVFIWPTENQFWTRLTTTKVILLLIKKKSVSEFVLLSVMI